MSPRRHAPATRKGAVCGALLLAATAASSGSWPVPRAAEEVRERGAPLCNGLTPTQTGEPGITLIGTAGDDVIVTKGAARVDSGAGDDSICVTGRGTAVVNAGPGDDFVGARAHKGQDLREPRFRRRRLLRRQRRRPGVEPGGVQPELARRPGPHRDRCRRRLRHQRQQRGAQHRRRQPRSGRRRAGDLRLRGGSDAAGRPGHQHLPAAARPGRQRRLDLRQRHRPGDPRLGHPAGVDVVPAVRPQGAARPDGPASSAAGPASGWWPAAPAGWSCAAAPATTASPSTPRAATAFPPATHCWSVARVTTCSPARTATTSCAAEGAVTVRTAEPVPTSCTAEVAISCELRGLGVEARAGGSHLTAESRGQVSRASRGSGGRG